MDEMQAVAQRYELTESERAWLAGRRDRVTLIRLVEQGDFAMADSLMESFRGQMSTESAG